MGKKKKDAAEAKPVAAAPAAKPAKAAKPAAARGVVLEKPKSNIYTVMLALSFVALVLGSVCLYMEWAAYQ